MASSPLEKTPLCSVAWRSRYVHNLIQMNFEALAQEKDKRKNREISFRRYYKLELSDEMF